MKKSYVCCQIYLHLFRSGTALSDLETGTKFKAEPSAFLGNKQGGVWSGKVPSEHKVEKKTLWVVFILFSLMKDFLK